MTKSIAYCALISIASILACTVVARPALLCDENVFLKNVVTHELLGILGIILSVTIATVSQIVFALNTIEERYEKEGLFKTRAGVRRASYFLIYLFVVALVIVVAKPQLATTKSSESAFNALALLVVVWNVLILHSILDLIFSFKPMIKGR